MNLNVADWKSFKISDILMVVNGKGLTTEEIDENSGDIPCVQGGESNNGSIGRISREYIISQKYVLIDEPCLTVARVGTAGCVNYWNEDCAIGDKCKALILKQHKTESVYLFIQSILSQLQYKFSYGRGLVTDTYMNEIIKLPVDSDDNPDWQYMEDYIKSLYHKPLTTRNKQGQTPNLNVQGWKYFLLKDICEISMGNKMDATAMTTDNPEYNFVGRSADNNGVAMKVDAVYTDNDELVKPYSAGCITVALGGSLGSTYLQKEPFYTSQNVSVLKFPKEVSDAAKLFLCTLIHNESLYKYFPFGRELNTHIRTDFGFTLPIDSNGNPDWQFMEDYIKALPYGDRLEG